MDTHSKARRLNRSSMELLGKSIPSGMLVGYVEPGFPLFYINDRMLEYLGYRYEEYAQDIGGMVLNSIHPDDRSRVNREVAEAFSLRQEYETRYRMRKKDGSYIHVSDVGKESLAEDGRKVFLSILRDITAEVETEENLRREMLEKERQTQKYDLLFQSVPCGIVQYRFDGRDGLYFRNANREAMRILGFTGEEFWQVERWSLAKVASADYQQMLRVLTSIRHVGDNRHFEFQVLRRDGSYCWILGKAEVIRDVDGQELIQSVFMDVDAQKRTKSMNRQLAELARARSEILNIALKHTSLCEFYYYPRTRMCVHPRRTCERYGWKEKYMQMPDSFAEEQVQPAFRGDFCRMYRGIQNGKRTAACRIRTMDDRWCRITMSAAGDPDTGEPESVIGIIEDITREQEMILALEEERSKDKLTGLWNREAGECMIRKALRRKPEERDALVLLDMDNFTDINEKEGVAFANAVLQEAADILCAEAGPEDILVRLGGDEFMAFFVGCSRERCGDIGRRISGRVSSLLPAADNRLPISVSIGMCGSEVAKEFDELYRCAGSALKYAKEKCPGGVVCYLEASNELGVRLTDLYKEEHPLNRIEVENQQRGENMISFALDILGNAKDLEEALILLFTRLGKVYRLDRVCFLEIDREYLSGRFSYQWARNKADLRTGRVFYITRQKYGELAADYDSSGLCEKPADPKSRPLASCLRAAVYDHGEYAGSLGFERKEDLGWTEEERRLIAELAKVISSFVFKTKADAVSQAKTDFLSRMSHEIRTPMNAIVGMTAIAKNVAGDREKVLECLDKLDSSNQYLLNLVNDILDMSRIESGKLELNPESVDIGQFLLSLEAMLRPQAEQKSIFFEVRDGYAEKRPLLLDKLRLEQVLINVIGNAIKFTGNGGSVIFSVTPAEVRGDGAVLRFSVKDNGIGIAPEAQKGIFNAFEQAERDTSRKYGGTGLGLAISGRLVQLMNGKLEVESELGKGSDFFFTLRLPFAEEEASRGKGCVAASHPENGKPDFTGKRILLVEDNELNLEIAQTLLEMQGFTVATAMDGQKALETFAESPAFYFDAVLMDIRMPVMDGMEATKRIRILGREDSRAVPIIAMTANAFDEDSRKSLESGMNGHLTKPVCVDDLMNMLRSCIKCD